MCKTTKNILLLPKDLLFRNFNAAQLNQQTARHKQTPWSPSSQTLNPHKHLPTLLADYWSHIGNMDLT